MKRDAELAVLMIVLFASLFLFDYAYNYSENAVFGSSVTGAVVVYTSSSSGSSNAICTVTGSKVKCSLNSIEYETSGECTRNCKSNLIQPGTVTPPSGSGQGSECAGWGETPASGQQCCSDLVPCNFCDNKCYNSCPNALCRAPETVSCQSDSDCLSSSCVSDSAGNKKCGAVAGSQQPATNPGSTADVCTVTGSKVKCSLNNAEYEAYGECTRNCKSNLIQPGTITPSSGSSQQGDGKGSSPSSAGISASQNLATIQIALKKGSNLISLSVTPQDTGIRQVAASVMDKVSIISRYYAGHWEMYVPSVTADNLFPLEPGKGYQFQMTDSATLEVSGIPYNDFPNLALDANVDYLLGIPYGNVKLSEVRGNCKIENIHLSTIDSDSNSVFLPVSSETTLLESRGYWIKSTESCMLGRIVGEQKESSSPSGSSQQGDGKGIVNPQTPSASASSQDVCTVVGSKAKCSLNGIEYETSGECTRNCKPGLVQQQAQTPPASCAGNGEVPGAGQQCCSGLVPCNFCGNKCYDSCPNTLCKAPYEVSCHADSDCLSGSCIADSAGNKKCGTATGTGTNQPPSSSTGQQDVCTVVGAKVKCSLSSIEYENFGGCKRYCKPGLVQQQAQTPPSGSGQGGGSGGNAGTPAVSGGPDLVIARVSSAPSVVYNGVPSSFKFVIKNAGDRDSYDFRRDQNDARVFGTSLFFIGADGTRYLEGGAETVNLRAGQEQEVAVSLNQNNQPPVGNYKYQIVVDDGDRIQEVDENNNVYDSASTVQVTDRQSDYGVDLFASVTGITGANGNAVSEILPGNRYRFTVDVENIGLADVPVGMSFWPSFYSILNLKPSQGNNIVVSSKLFSFLDMKSRKSEWVVDWAAPESLAAGSYTVFAEVDTQNVISEVNENNNDGPARSISVRARAGANLAVTSASAVPGVGNVYSAAVAIKNTGESTVHIADSSSAGINFIVLEAKVERNGQVVCKGLGYVYNAILPGAEVQVSPPISMNNCVLEPGNYILDVFVDSNNYIAETDEVDNRVRSTFTFGTGSGQACPGTGTGGVVVGYRTADGLYCDASGKLSAQKVAGQACVNSFECQGNFCAAGKCIEESLIRRLICTIISC